MELTIEKLVYGGDGLARLAAPDGGQRAKTIFIPYVLPGERVEGKLVEERPGFARALLEQVVQASPLRTEPPCAYFGRCGGCHYQHANYEAQLRLKAEILRETLRRTAKLDLALEIQTHASPPLGYRNRTRFHLRGKPEFAIGYFKHGSHELLPVRECPISSPLINRALRTLWSFGESGRLPSVMDQIELFANGNDDRLMLELYLHPGSANHEELIEFARELARAMPEIHGIAGFPRSEPRLRAPGGSRTGIRTSSPGKLPTEPHTSAAGPPGSTQVLYGEQAMVYELAGESYRVSAGAFFQTNRYLLPHMLELAIGGRKGRTALDLFSGVGFFAVPLARRFDRVVAVESSPVSASDLRANVPANVKVSSQSVEAYLTSAAGTLKPDLVVVDPPRAGLGSTVCEQITRLAAKDIVYVSCDPATLARDLKEFASGGWKVAEMHLIDVFPQTFHIETCTVLRRE